MEILSIENWQNDETFFAGFYPLYNIAGVVKIKFRGRIWARFCPFFPDEIWEA